MHENLIFFKNFCMFSCCNAFKIQRVKNLILFINLKSLIESIFKKKSFEDLEYISVFVVVIISHLRVDSLAWLFVNHVYFGGM